MTAPGVHALTEDEERLCNRLNDVFVAHPLGDFHDCLHSICGYPPRWKELSKALAQTIITTINRHLNRIPPNQQFIASDWVQNINDRFLRE